MNIHEVVKKLVGEIDPVGKTETDDERFENLKTITELVSSLINDIDKVAYLNKTRVEYSMKRAGVFANKFLDDCGIKE